MIYLCVMSCIFLVLIFFFFLFCNSEFFEWGLGEVVFGSGDRLYLLGFWVFGREVDLDYDVDVAFEVGDGGKFY